MASAALALFAVSLLFTARASAHSGDQLSAYGTATVDGVISPGEYGNSCIGPVSQTVGATSYEFKICETNDEQNDYYAVQINDLTADDDWPNFWFDNDHSGTVTVSGDGCPYGSPDEDNISWMTAGFFDGYYCRQQDQTTSFGADYFPEDFNGVGAHKFTAGVGSVFELSHPLDSGDPDDYSLVPHDTVGWCFTYNDESNTPPTNPGFAVGELQYPAGCFVDFANSNLGLVRGNSSNFADVFKLSELDAILARLKEKLKQYVATCRFCPPDPRKSLLEKVNDAIHALSDGKRGVAVRKLESFVDLTQKLIRSEVLPGKAKRFIRLAKSYAARIEEYEPPSPVEPGPAPVGQERLDLFRVTPGGERRIPGGG